MTKEELKTEAEELIQRFEMANSMNCFMQLTPDRKQIGEMLVMIAEPREKRIANLERKLEQAEKDLSDYQFNYPTIKELQKENAELKGIKDVAALIRANNDTVVTLMQLNNQLVSKNQQLTKAKGLLTKWVELYNPKLEGFPKTPVQEETTRFLTENK